MEKVISSYESNISARTELQNELQENNAKSLARAQKIRELNQTLDTLENTISATVKRLQDKLPDFQPVSYEFSLTSLQDFNDHVANVQESSNSLQANTTELEIEYDKHLKLANEHVTIIRDLGKVKDNSLLKGDPILGIFENFNENELHKCSYWHQELVKRRNMRASDITRCEQSFDLFVDIYAQEVRNILVDINEFQKTKMHVPTNPSIDQKQIVRLNWNFRPTQKSEYKYIADRIKHYFENLIFHREEFPEQLNSTTALISNLVQTCMKHKLKSITFLFPSPKGEKTQYRSITNILKSSGGETTTVGILLYCLLAHFRMRKMLVEKTQQQFPGARLKQRSSTLIMDNPLGKANRDDLVEMQIQLAKSLNVQLLLFSGHQEVDILQKFDTVIALKKYPYSGESIVEIDNASEFNSIKGVSILHRKQETLDSFE